MANLTNLLAALGGPLRGGAGLAALGVSRINALIETVRGLAAGDNLIAGRGIRLDKQLGKVVITSDAVGGKTAPADRTLLVYQASATEISVTVGVINNFMPKIGADNLNATPTPKLAIAATGVVFLHATLESNYSTSITALTVETAATVPANTATEGYTILAGVVFADSKITSVTPVAWNLVHMQKCGFSSYLWGGFGD